MTTARAQAEAAPGVIEAHSIDYIPQSERHGKVTDQFTLWFLGNANLSTLAVGLIAMTLGLPLLWVLVAIVLGEVFGTFFMAFHSVQGPRMGIPQLLQSRPQFGYLGALIPQFIGLFLYVGFNVFNTIIGGQALATLTGLDGDVASVIMAVAALVLTIGGYDWIHFVQKWGTYLFLVVFGLFTLGVLLNGNPPADQVSGDFAWTPFLGVIVIVASYQVSQAPYVSDYSRYLPRSSTVRSTFLWSYFGSIAGSFWMMALGAFLLASFQGNAAIDAVRLGGDALFDGYGTIVLTTALVGLVSVIALNLYSGSLAMLAMVDVVRPITASVTTRAIAIGVILVLGTAGAIGIPEDFLGSYNVFLIVLLYSLVPWTAINLVDFFFVRKGDYAILEIFKPNGIYGAWNWRGLVAYVIGIAVMVPFFAIFNGADEVFIGPIARSLENSDISLFVGLPVSALLYWLLCRNLNLGEERRLAAAEAAELEAAGEAAAAEAATAPA
ncbi:MAG TPA: cytosine permease [Candidatus Limnocylindria bacterium]|jgi:purine-cytosine permease-like protein|nr:cytosine permease [Candidatus Limnocylindria bacterium]